MSEFHMYILSFFFSSLLQIRPVTPSFALLDIQGPVVTTYVYQLIEGEVRVEKIEYRRPSESVHGASVPGYGGQPATDGRAIGRSSPIPTRPVKEGVW